MNTILFMIGATVVNLVIMIGLILLGFLIISPLVNEDTSAQMGQFIILAVFIVALVLAFLIYNRLTKFIIKKFNLEQYMDPLFKPRKPKP